MPIFAQILLSASLAANPAPSPTKTNLTIEDCEFGQVYGFSHGECQIALHNHGDKPIRVFDFKSNKDGDSIQAPEVIVQPKAQVYLQANLNSGNDSGNSQHVFRFQTDEPDHRDRVARCRGFVTSILDQARPALDFGVVNISAVTEQKSVSLTSHDTADFRITKILEAPSYLKAAISEDGNKLAASIRSDAAWGFHVDYIKLETNAQQQKIVWVGVQADIHGDVVPAANPFDMGLMRVGGQNEHLIRLTSTTAKKFTIGKIELEGIKGTTKVLPCIPAAEGCRLLKLTVADEQTKGSIKGKIWLSFPEFSQRLDVAVWGLLLEKDATIQKIDAEKIAAEKNTKDSQSIVPKDNAGVNVAQALKRAVKDANETSPAGKGPLLKWSVVNEAVIHGYQVFRAESATGPFVLINTQLIPKKDEEDVGSSYQWRDNSAESGKTYWYYVGSVANDGKKQQLNGPQKVLAK